MAGFAGSIMRVNKQIDALTKKAKSLKNQSEKEEAAFHASLMQNKAAELGRALSAKALFNKLSNHHHTQTKKGGKRK